MPEIAKHLGIGLNTAKKRVWIARREVRAAWLRHKARTRRAGSSNVVPILGPLTFREAGRQIPEAPDDVRARVWEGVQARIGGGGGPGSGPRAPKSPAPRLLANPAAAAMLAGLGGMAVGVLAGAAWDPFHRPVQAPAIVQVMTAPSSVAPPPPEAPPPATSEAAPSAASPALAAPTASNAGEPVDLDDVLVNRAEAAVRDGQVESALASVQRHATVFHGGGRRAHDRDVVWIAVLLRAGRTDEARQRLVSFARAYPRSPRLDDFRRTLDTP